MNPVAPVTKTLVPLKNVCISLIDSSPLVIVLFFFSPIYKMINLTSLHKSKANVTDFSFKKFNFYGQALTEEMVANVRSIKN